MYRLKIAGMDQVSFGPVPVLMIVKIIWSSALHCQYHYNEHTYLSWWWGGGGGREGVEI